MSFIVYMLVCSDDSFYIGLTTDLSRRLLAHESGFDPQSYTASRRPVKLVWAQEFPTHDEAFTFERQIKLFQCRLLQNSKVDCLMLFTHLA